MDISKENLNVKKTKNFEKKSTNMGGMNCEDIFGFKEDRRKKIKIEGEKICKIILNDVISNFETKQDEKNISRGILDSLIENFETSETRKSMCNEILESLVTNFEITSDNERKIFCDKNLNLGNALGNALGNSKIENKKLWEHMDIEEENPSIFGSVKSCIFTEKYLEIMKKNENNSDISPEKMDIDNNDNIKLQDSDGKLICQNILENVIENLDIGDMICEETINDLVGNLKLKSDQKQTNSSKHLGMDIFSRLLGF